LIKILLNAIIGKKTEVGFYMIREVVHDPLFLSGKSEKATKEDLQVAQDLLDTLMANRAGCVGMAANMIGVRKRIIAFDDNGKLEVMFNPEIIKSSGEYDTEEGCLSLLGDPRPCKRYQSIKVRWQNKSFQLMTKTFYGFTAQIIQHEIDHCNGVLI
jgi:peptide deformylase